jgi:hypothetical protein
MLRAVSVSQLAKIAVYIILAAIVIVWTFSLWSWAGLLGLGPNLGRDAKDVMSIFAVGLAVASGVLWLAAEIKVIELAPKTRKAIWGTLIVAVLGISVSMLRTTDAPSVRRLRIDRLELLELAQDTAPPQLASPITVKSSPVYDSATAPVAVIAVVSGFARDKMGNPNLKYRFYLEHPSDLRAHYFEDSRRYFRRSPANKTQLARLTGLFGNIDQSVLLSHTWAQREDIGTGNFVLRAIITDVASGETVEETKALVINGGSVAARSKG